MKKKSAWKAQSTLHTAIEVLLEYRADHVTAETQVLWMTLSAAG